MASKEYNVGGFLFPLFLVFLVLKLTETIDWSWWWVTAPLWMPWAIAGIIFAIVLLLGVFVGGTDSYTKKVRERQREALRARKRDDVEDAYRDL